MSEPGGTLRDQGVQQLREGNLDRAVDLLVRAVMQDDADAEAKAALGIAYSQKGMHPQAARALLTAVERQPGNASFRYNLAVVLERAGDLSGAVYAYRDALTLSPQLEAARNKLQAFGAQAHQILAGQARPASAGPATGVGGAGPDGVPATPPPAPQYAPPMASPSVGAPPPMGGPTGYSPSPPSYQTPPPSYQTPPAHQPPMSMSGYSDPPPPSGVGSYVPPMGSGYGAPNPVTLPPPPPPPPGPSYVEDSFNPITAVVDAGRAMFQSRDFFSDQANYVGFKGPMAFLLMVTVVQTVCQLVMNVALGFPSNAVLLPCQIVGGWLVGLIVMFVAGGYWHLICRMFGGRGAYSSTVRAYTYSQSPYLIAGIVATVMIPLVVPTELRDSLKQLAELGARQTLAVPSGEPLVRLAQAGGRPSIPSFSQRGVGGRPVTAGRPTPADDPRVQRVLQQIMAAVPRFVVFAVIQAAFWIWGAVLLGVGVAHAHSLGTGQAVGVVIVGGLISLILLCALPMFAVILPVFVAARNRARGLPP